MVARCYIVLLRVATMSEESGGRRLLGRALADAVLQVAVLTKALE